MLLPIYRITNDQIVENPTVDNQKTYKPDDAKGLAMSAIGTVGYNFNVKTGIKLLVGHKIVQRDVNPDGLTREFVTSFSLLSIAFSMIKKVLILALMLTVVKASAQQNSLERIESLMLDSKYQEAIALIDDESWRNQKQKRLLNIKKAEALIKSGEIS